MKVVLAGNPNAGKTTLFNALTKSKLKTGNWHGVTTFAVKKKVGENEFIDVPGAYSFSPYSMEEKSAISEILNADIIVNVVDALTLKNSLNLTKNLLALNKKTVVYITKVKALKRRKGSVNIEKLSKILGVPVVDSYAKLRNFLNNPSGIPFPQKNAKMQLNDAYYGGNLQINRLERLFYNKYFAVAFFIFAMVFTFFITFHPYMIGARLKDALQVLICQKFSNVLKGVIQNELLQSFICEGLIGGVGGVLSFLPQLTVLYFLLIVLDESGIMSALAFVTDGVFERVNLSGRAAFSIISGFGCTAAAILTTRGFIEKSTQKRAISVLAFIPCGAKLPVFLTFLSPVFKNPFPAICLLYFIGVGAAILGAKLINGKAENLFTEVTPISLPQLKGTQIKLFFYLKGFIIKVVTAITLFCIISWLLSHFSFTFKPVPTEKSMLAQISKLTLPLFYPMGVNNWRVAYAVLSGFAAKENVAATIIALMPNGANLPFASALALSTFILFAPACVSAFTASVKEVGLKFTLKYNTVQIIIALLLSYAVYFTANLF